MQFSRFNCRTAHMGAYTQMTILIDFKVFVVCFSPLLLLNFFFFALWRIDKIFLFFSWSKCECVRHSTLIYLFNFFRNAFRHGQPQPCDERIIMENCIGTVVKTKRIKLITERISKWIGYDTAAVARRHCHHHHHPMYTFLCLRVWRRPSKCTFTPKILTKCPAFH